MLSKKPKQTIAFNSGLLVPLEESRGAIIRSIGEPLPYGERTVGFNRFYTAAASGVDVAAVFVIPLTLGQSALDRVRLVEARSFRTGKSRIYKVAQIQIKQDEAPPCLMITLQETGVAYVDQRPADERLERC